MQAMTRRLTIGELGFRRYAEPMKVISILLLMLPAISMADDMSCSGALIDSMDDLAHTARLRHAAGDEEVATEGMVLVPGDTLATGADSTVDLGLCDGSEIRVGPSSEYFLDHASDSSTVTELLRGSVRAIVAPSTAPSDTVRFQVRTPTGVIGVRGTEFVVEENDGESQLYTLEGEVLYGGEDMVNEMRKPFSEIQNRVTVVKKGEQSRIARGTRVPVRPQTFQRTQIEKRPVFRRAFQAKPADLFQRQRQMIRARTQERMKRSANSRPVTKPTRVPPPRKESLQPRRTKTSPLKQPPTRLEKSKILSPPTTSSKRVSPMRPSGKSTSMKPRPPSQPVARPPAPKSSTTSRVPPKMPPRPQPGKKTR